MAQERPLAPVPKIVETGFIDTTCAPCKDFYQFANGRWLAHDTIPPEYTSWGVIGEAQERNEAQLRQILETAARERATGNANTKRIGTFYATCMDSAAADRVGAGPLAHELGRIAAINGRRTLFAELARLHLIGVDALFAYFAQPDPLESSRYTAWAYQAGLGMPDRDYYTRTDPTSDSLRTDYVAHVARTLALLGVPESTAQAEARRIMTLEHALATASLTLLEQRDPHNITHKRTYAQLAALSPGVPWTTYLQGLGIAGQRTLNVATPKFFSAVSPMVSRVPLADWRAYLRWRLVDAAAPWLSRAFADESFRWNARLTGRQEQPSRWRRCLQRTDGDLGEALGQAYVAAAFPPEARERARALVQEIREAFRRRVDQLDWMSDSTKARAVEKLDAMTYKVGYPDTWRDYSRLEVAEGPFVLNWFRATEFETRRRLARLGQPVDRTEWEMTPPTINAYYDPLFNEMVLPAGQLRIPFFDPAADDAANLGATGGGTVGHELTHGFDDEGRQYDARGNLRDWWTADDARRFTERVARQFDAFVAIDTVHVNGRLSLGENLADFGGMVIAYDALQQELAAHPTHALIAGFTPEQRFFLAYAQSWRIDTRPEMLRLRAQTDPHAPPRWRVNGPLANMVEFARAFGCRAGDPMVRPDSLRASVW
jgi:predicted metalloendopeptidase